MKQGITRWQLTENSSLIAIYAWLRLSIALLLVALFRFASTHPIIGDEYPSLFNSVSITYVIIALLAAFYLQRKRGAVSVPMIVASFLVDVLALSLLTHASGGINSGLPIILIVLSSIAGILLGPRLAIFIAAASALAILLETAYRSIVMEFFSGGFALAGLYGMACFAACLLILNIASRLRVSQQLAISREADVAKLQQLNQLVVERLRTGLMVLDWNGQILMANRAAKDLVFNADNGANLSGGVRGGLATLPTSIKYVFDAWREDHQNQPMPIRLQPVAHELQINFTSLTDQPQGDVLAFIDDQTELSQRAQQMKLASLGRFAASIAHEIRNPLGAISHAAQLLSESEALDEQDLQLSNIIQNHCLRMNRVIENVLQLSRRHQARQEVFSLKVWLDKFIAEFEQSQNYKADIRIDVRKDISIKFDPDHLSQIMNNLLDNALRYSHLKTGVRQAVLQIYEHADNGLPCIDVIDYGEGISGEDRDRVFEPFFTTETKGNGLGLYLCRQLCEANQAVIAWLKNPASESCFRILFAHPDRRGWTTNESA